MAAGAFRIGSFQPEKTRNEYEAINESKYEDTYVAAMLGQLASCKFYAGELVYAVLRFQTREYNGQMFQDILAVELIKMKN